MQALAVYAKSTQQENCFDALPDGSNILRIELQLKNKKSAKHTPALQHGKLCSI